MLRNAFSWLSNLILHPGFISLLLYPAIYHQIFFLWKKSIGNGAWEPAWPIARTRLIIGMLSVPLWALFMMIYILFIWACRKLPLRKFTIRSRSDYEYHQLSDMDFSRSRPTQNRSDRKLAGLSKSHLAVFGILASMGPIIYITSSSAKDLRYKSAVETAMRYPRSEGYGNQEKIFIAAMFYNNEQMLPYWCKEMVKTIHYLGVDNVFVSVVESYSNDNTASILLEFDSRLEALGIERSIRVNDHSITRPDSMETKPPRIEFLAATRNLVLEPLRTRGNFDKVLFSNDVFVEAESIVELLNTNSGDWDMVCGMDLSYWGLYDAWVTRDALGRIVPSKWPYFFEDAGMKNSVNDDPVPVFSCWNGITAFRAEPFLPKHLRKQGGLSSAPVSLPDTHPNYPSTLSPDQAPPLHFRASLPGECFSSESFLLPYDLRRQFDLQQIYINPLVITSYEWRFYVWYKFILRHWVVQAWMRQFEDKSHETMMAARMVVGDPNKVFSWDGGECHPWW